MKEIIFISKIPISNFPRLMSIPLALSKIGCYVTIWAPGKLPKSLDGEERIRFEKLDFTSKAGGYLSKLYTWYRYRINVVERLRLTSNKIVWLSSADSAIPLFGKIDNKNIYLLQVNELYDDSILYRFFLKRIIKKMKTVIVPEYNRANVLRVWFDLIKLPFVLPNKSIVTFENSPNEQIIEIINEINKIKSEGFKIIIYQGHLSKDRDFSNFVKILSEVNEKVHLILLGKDHGMVKKYLALYKHVSWVNHIKSPDHLLITQLADLGIIFYNPDTLNNIFCAPNKIWEYSKYGIPIITNDLPGIIDVSRYYKAGISCCFESKLELKDAVDEIFRRYTFYSENSLKMYESLDYCSIIKNILEYSVDGSSI